jgi:hypothetical protein
MNSASGRPTKIKETKNQIKKMQFWLKYMNLTGAH